MKDPHRRAHGAALASALLSVLLADGCASRRTVPRDLRAVPAGQSAVRLSWSPDPRSDGFVVERRAPDGAWRPVGAALPPTSDGWVDRAATPRELGVYRVATIAQGRRSDWATAEAVPVFVGKPLFGWLDATAFPTCRIPRYGPARGLACALDQLGGRTEPGADPTEGPHVLWIPPGTYDLSRTLWLEGRAGVQIVGRPGETVLRWIGPRGTGPDATRVMFHAEGNRDSTWRGLTWDGGCDDPATCWVVAFDQSFCGRSDLPILRSASCDAGTLRWPERPTVGQSANGNAHFDSTFRNATIGLRIGHHGVADDVGTHRRSVFRDDFIGVGLEDFNALRHWFWDATFERNFVGVTNNVPEVLHTYDPAWAPGRCDDGSRCYSNADCDRAACRWKRRWAGDYSILRGRFRNSVWADVWAEPTGEYVVRETTSSGSRRFFFAGGPNATPGRFSLIGNRVRTQGGPAIRGRTPGPFLLADNAFFVGGPIGRFDSATDLPRPASAEGTVDLLAVGNALDGERWSLGSPTRLLEIDEHAAESSEVEPPPPPAVVDALDTLPIYTVVGANGDDPARNADVIQAVIDAAGRDARPAVVHFPGAEGRYLVGHRLHIPAGSDLTLAGDGAWTTLQWAGAVDEPMFDIRVSTLRGLTLRDLQVRHSGIVIRDGERDAASVLLSQVRIAEAGVAALVIDGLRSSGVDIAELQANGGLFAGGTALGVVIRDAEVRWWSGITLRNELDFDVIHDALGADVLIEGNYMENSHHHLRARGAAPGRVVLHGAKIAPVVPAENGLDDAVTAIAVEGGTLDLVESQLFLIPPGAGGGSSPAATAVGARIRVSGGATARSVGTTVRTAVEYVVDAEGTYTRIAGKQAQPQATPLPQIQADAGGRHVLDESAAREVLVAATRRLRDARLPPFYDEVGAEDRYRVRLDKVFIFKAPGVGLHLVATRPCNDDRACARTAGGGACRRTGLDPAIPGRCE